MSRTLTVDINLIDPRVGDKFGFRVTNNGQVLTFDDGIGWDKTFVEQNEPGQLEMNHITKFNSDLTLDNIYSSFNGPVYDSAVQTDGKLIVVGDFDLYDGNFCKNICRLNTDGTFDPIPNMTTGTNNIVRVITLGSGNEIYIGGDFTRVNDSLVNRICRLNTNGTVNTTFVNNVMSAATNKGFNDSVNAIVLTTGGLYIGGKFTNFNNTGRNRIIRLLSTGTPDSAFNVGTGFTGGGTTNVNTLFVSNSGTRLMIGGDFSNYKGTSNCNNIVKVQLNGTLDTTFTQGLVNTGANGQVNRIRVVNSDTYVGGNFTTYNGVSRAGLVKITNDGVLINIFGTGFTIGVNDVRINGDEIVVVGNMDSYNGVPCGNIVTLNSTTGALVNQRRVNSSVSKINIIGGDVVVVGFFTQITSDSVSSNSFLTIPLADNLPQTVQNTYDNLVEFNSGVGITYSIINNLPITSENMFDSTTLLYLSDFSTPAADGSYFLYGNFTTYNGLVATRVIKLTAQGEQDFTFNTTLGGPNANPFAGCRLYRLSNDGLLVAGVFSTYNNVAGFGIRKLEPNGSIDPSLTPGTLGLQGGFRFITKVELQPDNKIILGGLFSTYNGVTSRSLVRINPDGSIDNTFNVGVGFNNTTIDVVVNEDSTMYVTGYFTSYKGVAARGIIKLSATASIDTSFVYGSGFTPNNNSTPNFLLPTIGDNNSVYCAGAFTSYKGVSANRIIKLTATGSVDTIFNTGSGFDGDIELIRYTKNNERIFLTGQFTSYNGTPTEKAVILNLDGSISQTYTATGFTGYYNIGDVVYAIDGNKMLTKFQNIVRMDYTFDDDEVVVQSSYDTPGHVELNITNESLTINDLIQEVLVRSPYLIISNAPTFSSVNYKIRVYEGSIFTGPSQSISYDITKNKLFTGQTNIYVNINNLIRERLEANVTTFIDDSILVSQLLPDNMSKWVLIDETIYDGTATASFNKYYLHALDGFLYNFEEQGSPNVFINGDKRYVHQNQPQRIYFQTNFLEKIIVRTDSNDTFDYEPTWDSEDILGDNRKYIQSLKVDTQSFGPGTKYVDYIFTYRANNIDVQPETFTITKRFNVYLDCKYELYTIVYKNKFGLLESIPFSKKSSKGIDIKGVDFERSILDFNGNYDITRHTNKQFNVTGNENWTLNTDWMPEYMNVAFEELGLSEEVWIIKEDQTIIPVIKEDTRIDFKTVLNDKLIQYTIKVKLSHQVIKNIL